MDEWDYQQRHLKSHNLFYSAVYGEVDEGLADHGYRITGEFTIAENRKKDAHCQPPFTLYNNQNLVFVDIIGPGTITEDEIERLSQYNNLDRESVEGYLDRCNLSVSGYSKYELENFDSCFVMSRQQYESHLSGSPKLQRKLDRLETEGSILTVSPGGALKKQTGGIHGSKIDKVLGKGISVPERTGKYVHLPLEVRQESLAVAICEEIVAGSDLSQSGISLQESDIGNYFGRDIEYDIAHRVLEYLRKINACRVKRGENAYTFTKYNLDVILSIRKRLKSDPINTVLSDDLRESADENRSLNEFTN